jgi:very-short-patch-repair endonuclease
MHKRTTPKVFGHAKQLHRNLTPAEVKMWARLRAHRLQGIHFRNQHAIGNYIVDCCAPRKKLIIELDGSQHMEQEEYDKERTEYLVSKGYTVLRFWNNDVMKDLDSVIRAIIQAMESESHL